MSARVFSPRWLALCLVFFPLATRAAEPVLMGPDMGFSATLPVKWTLTDLPGNKYRIGVGPTVGEFRVNAVLSPAISDEDLDGLVNVLLPDMKIVVPGFKLLSMDDFTTGAGQVIKRLVTESQLREPHLEFIYIGKAQGDHFFILKCSAPISQSEEFANVFDGIAKSIKIAPDPKAADSAEAAPKEDAEKKK